MAKYVCVVVIETDKKVFKNDLRAWLESQVTMADPTLVDKKYVAKVTKARVRSVDID